MKSRLDFHRVTRRVAAVAIFLSAAGGLLTVSSCNKETTEPNGQDQLGPEGEKSISLLTWDEYFDPAVLKEFTARTGIAVRMHFYESTAEMLEKLKSDPQQYDVVITEEVAVGDMRDSRLLRPLSPELLPNRKNLDRRYLGRSFDPNNAYTLPYTWGTTLLAYRKDLLPEPPVKSWSLLLEPALAGHIAMLDERNECFAVALRSVGVDMAGADDAAIAKATELLVRIAKDQRCRFGSDNDMKEELISGRSWIAQMYSGDAALIASAHDNIGYFIPDEGATIWLDNFAIPRDTQRPISAHQFIDFMSEAKIAAQTANFLRYASPNREAQPLIDPTLRADTAIHPVAELLSKCDALPDLSLNTQRAMNQGWQQIHTVAQLCPKSEESPGAAKTAQPASE